MLYQKFTKGFSKIGRQSSEVGFYLLRWNSDKPYNAPWDLKWIVILEKESRVWVFATLTSVKDLLIWTVYAEQVSFAKDVGIVNVWEWWVFSPRKQVWWAVKLDVLLSLVLITRLTLSARLEWERILK